MEKIYNSFLLLQSANVPAKTFYKTGIIFILQAGMIREIFTLVVDKIPIQYYIRFEKERQRFFFQATLKNKSAPSFTITVSDDQLITEPSIDESIARQAVQKVREIVADKIFDRF